MSEQKKIAYLNIGEVQENQKNVMIHGESQIEKICASIKEFGFTNPILIDENKVILAGHGRFAAAKKLGMENIPVIFIRGLSDDQKTLYMIADNKLSRESEWNEDNLKNALSDISEKGQDVSVSGFDFSSIQSLFGSDGEKFSDNGDSDEDEDEDEESDDSEPIEFGKGETRGVIVNAIKIGKFRIRTDESEMKSFEEMINRYVERTGTLYGFFSYLVKMESKNGR